MNSLINTLGETNLKMIFFGLMFVVFYFLIIRPKQKQEQHRGDFIKNLKKGQKVVTIGGIHAEVVEVSPKNVVLAIDKKGSQLTVVKEAIAPQT